jgi:DNA-binding PadR family transcriptional regulator
MPRTESPLPTAALHILLAIGPDARHGYAIMTEVVTSTAGSVRLAPGTLYTNIKRLLAAGLIEEAESPVLDDGDDARRRYYRLSASGRGVVAAEVARMEGLVARARGWVREPSR